MVRFSLRMIDRLADWRRFCALLTLIFACRAVFVLSVLPPFEGWDEYQHLAYIAYLVENGRPPVQEDGNEVPRSLYPALVRYPHSRLAVAQLAHIGVVGYDAFWQAPARPAVRVDAGPVALYQAQQASLYYRLVAPVFIALPTASNMLSVVTVLRVVNVLFGAAALNIALWIIGHLLEAGPHRHAVGLLIALQPLWLLNCARVANDALAVLLGSVAIAALLVLVHRHYWRAILLGGTALGLAILAKTINLTLVPFAVFAVVSTARQQRMAVVKIALGVVLLLGPTVALTLDYFHFNLSRFGMLTPMQEAVANQEAGKTLVDLARTALQIDWRGKLESRYFRYGLWFGGWSWLQAPPILKSAHQYNIYLAILGMCFALRRAARRDRLLFQDGATAWRLAVLCLCVAAGLAYHAVHTKTALGTIATNSWYAAVSFPWLLCLYYQGLAFYPGRWPARALAFGMIVIYLAAEAWGTLAVMVPAYTGAPWGPIARQRLTRLHLPGCGPDLTIPALGMTLLLVALALASWFRASAPRKTPGLSAPPGCLTAEQAVQVGR